MYCVTERLAQALAELETATKHLDPVQFDDLIVALARARRVFLAGGGREGLAARAFAIGLMHLGREVHWLWDETTPAIGPGDLLVVVSDGTQAGYIEHVLDEAANAGANTALIVGSAKPPTVKVQTVICVPASFPNSSRRVAAAKQPSGNLLAQVLLILFDQIVAVLADRLGVSKQQMASRHRNIS